MKYTSKQNYWYLFAFSRIGRDFGAMETGGVGARDNREAKDDVLVCES